MDKGGNLYGTTYAYGAGYGTVYQLKHKGSGWTFNPLYSFAGGSDGANPLARVIFGPNGTLYGTTKFGGGGCENYGCGTVFNLRPSPSACKSALCSWIKTVLYDFKGPRVSSVAAQGGAGEAYPVYGDGAYPLYGDLIFDQKGNVYGTTITGGQGSCDIYFSRCGTVFELSPSGGGWNESVLYVFSGNDGGFPYNGLTFDNAGNLYGTTYVGGLSNAGTFFELAYSIGWTETFLSSFRNGNDGSGPTTGLIFDQSGNLYGATESGGKNSGGTVFEFSPSPDGTWTYSLLYSFTGGASCGSWGNLVMDGAGNLYGTTLCDGTNKAGNVFKLTPSGGSWTYTSLHDFTGGSDGKNPYSNVVIDANGNLYGTTYAGGSQGVGVVWEITP